MISSYWPKALRPGFLLLAARYNANWEERKVRRYVKQLNPPLLYRKHGCLHVLIQKAERGD